jgi:outer membrane protein
MRKVIISAIVLVFALNAAVMGQTYKFGHINVQELLAALPESDSAQKKLQKESDALTKQLESMQVELNNKYQQYLTKRDSLSQLIKETREAEINDLNERIQKFQGTAQQSLQKRRGELLQPIYDKADKAIKDVAKENKFTYIFDTSIGALVYFSEESIDLMPLVKKKLGISK